MTRLGSLAVAESVRVIGGLVVWESTRFNTAGDDLTGVEAEVVRDRLTK